MKSLIALVGICFSLTIFSAVGYCNPDGAKTAVKTDQVHSLDVPMVTNMNVYVSDYQVTLDSHFINMSVERFDAIASTANLSSGLFWDKAVPEKTYKCALILKSGGGIYLLKYPPKIRKC